MEAVFERFADESRQVVMQAQEEARLLGHNYIGTEHLLLAMLSATSGEAHLALSRRGVMHDVVLGQVVDAVGRGAEPNASQTPFTPRAKKVLELGLRQAIKLGDRHIGSGHLLLGLLQEAEGVAVQILGAMGIDLAGLRDDTLTLLVRPAGARSMKIGEAVAQMIGDGPRCPRCMSRLDEVLRTRVVEATADAGDESRPVTVAYCGRCGAALGTE